MPNVLFDISTALVLNGKELKAVHPDAEGVYRGIPLVVLGLASRNRVEYEVNSVLAAIKNPESRFFKCLQEGNLEGEWRHPIILSKEEVNRINIIDTTLTSHYICHVYAKQTDDGKYMIVYGDIVPSGPYGPFLKESFADPKRNTSFSLRSLCEIIGVANGITRKRIAALITFDHVDGSGYEQTCKRWQDSSVVSTESLDATVSSSLCEYLLDDPTAPKEQAMIAAAYGFEDINHQQVLDLLRTDKITVCKEVNVVFDPKSKQLITPAGSKSPFHTMFNSRGK